MIAEWLAEEWKNKKEVEEATEEIGEILRDDDKDSAVDRLNSRLNGM